MITKKTLALALSLTGFAALFAAGPASAVPCANLDSGIFTDSTAGTSASTACEDGTTKNDLGNPFGVNANGGLFGFDDWQLWDSSDDEANELNEGGLTGDGSGAVEGDWDIAGIWDDWATVMITLKDGGVKNSSDAAGCDPGTANDIPEKCVYYSGYLVKDGLESGWWIYGGSPLKALSDISVWVREGAQKVPEPTTLTLLGIGLLGLGAARRRRKP